MVLVHNRYCNYGVGRMNFVSDSIGRIYSALTFLELKAEWRSIWLLENLAYNIKHNIGFK